MVVQDSFPTPIQHKCLSVRRVKKSLFQGSTRFCPQPSFKTNIRLSRELYNPSFKIMQDLDHFLIQDMRPSVRYPSVKILQDCVPNPCSRQSSLSQDSEDPSFKVVQDSVTSPIDDRFPTITRIKDNISFKIMQDFVPSPHSRSAPSVKDPSIKILQDCVLYPCSRQTSLSRENEESLFQGSARFCPCSHSR